MKSKWIQYRVSDFAKVQGGYAFKSGDFCNKGIPVIKITNVKERNMDFSKVDHIDPVNSKGLERFYINKGDVLISLTGNGPHCDSALVGRVALFNDISGKYLLNQRVGRFQINKDIVLPNYFYYFISQPEINRLLATLSTGSANQANINASTIEKLEVVLPCLEYQRQALEILSTIDQKIEVNKQTSSTLEQIAQTIFRSWFVNYDPVHAKKNALEAGLSKAQAERAAMAVIAGICSPAEYAQDAKETEEKLKTRLVSIGKEKTKELEKTASLFPSEFLNEGTNDKLCPWSVEPLGDYLEIKRGASPRPIQKYMSATGYPWTKISDATENNNPFILKTKEFIKEEGLKNTVFLQRGSLILSNSATPGLPRFLDLDACVHDGWLHFPAIKHFSSSYLYFQFLELRTHLVQQGNGSVFTNLKTDIIRNQKVSVPPKEIMHIFSWTSNLILELIKTKTRENESLCLLRDTLLPKLLSGQLNLEKIQINE